MIYNKLLSNKLEANLGYSLYSCIYGSISIEADDLKKINNFAEIYQKSKKSKKSIMLGRYNVLNAWYNYGIIIVFKMEVMKMPKIIPIKELKNTSEISEMCHKSNEPVYVTKNGYGDMVIMSMEAFEGISERLKMYQSLIISEEQMKEGKVKDARASLASVREKYAL